MLDLAHLFEHYDDEFLKFDRIERPLNARPDLCAFLMLDQIVAPETNRLGGKSDMVAAAEHDEIFLDVDTEQLAKLATEDQIKDLVRCGVRYDKYNASLAMFV